MKGRGEGEGMRNGRRGSELEGKRGKRREEWVHGEGERGVGRRRGRGEEKEGVERHCTVLMLCGLT